MIITTKNKAENEEVSEGVLLLVTIAVVLIACCSPKKEHKIDSTCSIKTKTTYCYIYREMNDKFDCIYVVDFTTDPVTGKDGYEYLLEPFRYTLRATEFDTGFCSIYKEVDKP